MQNTQPELFVSEEPKPQMRSTIALSLLLHGEAVRFNRGNRPGPFAYDFKHMIDWNKNVVPYVSSQSFKKNWRETLPFEASEIIRNKDKDGKKVNHAYTSGDPMRYADDDLFGYMIAGASNTEDKTEAEADTSGVVGPDEQGDKLTAIAFLPDSLKVDKSWMAALKKADDKVAAYLVEQFPTEAREKFEEFSEVDKLPDELRQPIADALNETLENGVIFDDEHFGKTSKKSSVPMLPKKAADALKAKEPVALKQAKYDVLETHFKSCFEVPKNRATTRRTAPIRMHAPIAFCGIKLAKDFQTFSRHIAATGENSVLNPNAVGIYSGWLKTRILIEAFRVGKYYIGPNMDILEEQAEGFDIKDEPNPYDRDGKRVRYIQDTDEKRRNRVSTALVSLGDIGNAHGPASGALHDGSLRPKAFIGAAMNCADSPFDNVWEDNNGTPRLNLNRLRAVVRDWDDLFLDKTIYIGVSSEMLGDSDVDAFSESVTEVLKDLNFKVVVDTPRRVFKQMAEQIAI